MAIYRIRIKVLCPFDCPSLLFYEDPVSDFTVVKKEKMEGSSRKRMTHFPSSGLGTLRYTCMDPLDPSGSF